MNRRTPKPCPSRPFFSGARKVFGTEVMPSAFLNEDDAPFRTTPVTPMLHTCPTHPSILFKSWYERGHSMRLLHRLFGRRSADIWKAEARLMHRLGLVHPPEAVQWISTSACDLTC